MHERLMEIVMELLREIDACGDGKVRLRNLSERLRKHGFSENELNAALSWLIDRLQTQEIGSSETTPSKGSVRVLHPVERLILTPEAFGYLLHLEDVGLLDRDQMETVIERALASGTNTVTIDDIKMMTATIVFGYESSDWISQSTPWSDDDKIKVH